MYGYVYVYENYRGDGGRMLIKTLVTLAGLAAIAWVNWYFLVGNRER